MSQQYRISHTETILFSRWNAPGQSEYSAGRMESWTSDELDHSELISCVASFDSARCFNSIEVGLHASHPGLFPDSFRFEISQDGLIWEPILREADFHARSVDRGLWNFPLITARHIKFIFSTDRKNGNGKYQCAFGHFRIGISGIVKTDVSSELDRLWVKENLIDSRPDYGWSSALRSGRTEEFIELDLGSINRVGELRLLSKNDPDPLFPAGFRITYSEDNISWHHLIEENGFVAEPGTWYRWRFVPHNMRHIRLTIEEGARTREGKVVSQIIELELYAFPDSLEDRQDRVLPVNVPYASVIRSGIIRMAMDGEVREGVAVQASDRRLKDATTEARGIVELASDGEIGPGLAVQSNDRRLKIATEDLPGIVRLARDGEERAGNVVQSNDSRLKYASEEAAGLVELAADGEIRPGVVVQSNDRRLKPATVAAPGIVKLADNGSDKPNEVVQGSDRRLKDATTEQKGIMRFARGGETEDDAAVQGSDPRLRKATTEAPGIIELAQSGEDRAGVVVQGNDHRLKLASEERAGILSLAPAGSTMAGLAVQGNDPRLSDNRDPRPHEHPYAPVQHSYDSHTGHIRMEESTGEPYKAIVNPPLDHAPITGINTGGGAGLVGQGKQEGVLGSGELSGITGLSPATGDGVLGASRRGAGGRFISETGFSLIAGGEKNERGLLSSGPGLLVHGSSLFTGTIHGSPTTTPAIAMYFEVEDRDVILPGDILVASEKDGCLRKSREQNSTRVIGVVVENASIIMNTPEQVLSAHGDGTGPAGIRKPVGMELVAISGLVPVRVIVEKEPIRPGDLLVTSIESGKADRIQSDNASSLPPGSLLGKALQGLEKGEGLIQVLLLGRG